MRDYLNGLIGKTIDGVPALLLAVLLFLPATGYPAYDYIDITNPFLKKMPIAVPLFKNLSHTGRETRIAEETSRLMENALDFTGYFKIIDRGAFLEYPHEIGIDERSLHFRNWTGIGAEMLITGGVGVEGDRIKMELRLFDTFKQRLIFGRKYFGEPGKERWIVHKFCNEVIRILTGSYGIFDSRIAYVSNGTGSKEIYICDFDGYHPEQITDSKRITLSPAWSSDGKWLAYTDYARGKPDLYIKNLTQKKGFVVSRQGANITPAWVPNSFSLAATLSFSGDQEIYMLTGTGKIIKRLTNNWGIDVSPSFSPDGKKMAFVSKRSGTPQLYIKDLSSGQVKRLTFEGRYNTSPAWSPRGDKIAYASTLNGQFDIFVIGSDGSRPTALTSDAGNNESPTWSPDGSMIAFSSTREGKNRIYVMTAQGMEQRKLLDAPGEQTSPRWSPRLIQ